MLLKLRWVITWLKTYGSPKMKTPSRYCTSPSLSDFGFSLSGYPVYGLVKFPIITHYRAPIALNYFWNTQKMCCERSAFNLKLRLLMPSKVHHHHGCRTGICLLCTVGVSFHTCPEWLVERPVSARAGAEYSWAAVAILLLAIRVVFCVQHMPKPLPTWKRPCFWGECLPHFTLCLEVYGEEDSHQMLVGVSLGFLFRSRTGSPKDCCLH